MLTQADVVFIRHAQSAYNIVSHEFRVNKKLGYGWENISRNREFLHQVKYNPKLIDAPITQEGIKQCLEAKQVMDYKNPDVIIVSPLQRTLQTCQLLFGNRQIPIFVQPILAEALTSACDIGTGIEGKKLRFPNMDFTNAEKCGDFWWVKNQSQAHIQAYEEIIKKNEGSSLQTVNQSILKHLEETFIYEEPANMRERTKKMKEVLLKYKEKYNNIVVVSHFNSINYMICRQYDDKNEPVEKPVFFNCQIYEDKLSEIIKYQ